MNTQPAIFSSPLPGKVVKILAREGELVEQGQEVFIVESLKTLHTLQAVRRGHMRQISVKEGDMITPQNQLASLE